jgi:hypothetical protein
MFELRQNHPALGGTANTGITVLRYIPQGLRLVSHNDSAHIDAINP